MRSTLAGSVAQPASASSRNATNARVEPGIALRYHRRANQTGEKAHETAPIARHRMSFRGDGCNGSRKHGDDDARRHQVGMATVGLIGGLGPESTVDYYRRLLEAWQREDPSTSPSIVIDSLDARLALRLVEKDLPALTEYLLASLRRLAGAG